MLDKKHPNIIKRAMPKKKRKIDLSKHSAKEIAEFLKVLAAVNRQLQASGQTLNVRRLRRPSIRLALP